MSDKDRLIALQEGSRHLLWMLMEFNINRYLMANTEGRLDGAEKAHRHLELCKTFIQAYFCCPEVQARRCYLDEYNEVHDHTQYLTDFMDEEIGFDTNNPSYDKMAPLFFDRFIELAKEALIEFKP